MISVPRCFLILPSAVVDVFKLMVDDNVSFDVDEVNAVVLFVISRLVVDVVDGTDVEVTKKLCGAT